MPVKSISICKVQTVTTIYVTADDFLILKNELITEKSIVFEISH